MATNAGPSDVDATMRDDTDKLEWLGIPLLRRLAGGEPVAIEDLAGDVGSSAEQVRRVFADQCDIEYDELGRIVGSGITLQPTQHRFQVDGRQLYTWCALDTLIYPAMIGKSARVESPCFATGAIVHVRVEPDRIASVYPAEAVVSIVTSCDRSAIRASFCDQVHFFARAEVARGWLEQHPGAKVVPVAEAQKLGWPLIQSLPVVGGRVNCC